MRRAVPASTVAVCQLPLFAAAHADGNVEGAPTVSVHRVRHGVR